MMQFFKNTVLAGTLLAALAAGGCSSPQGAMDDAWRNLIPETFDIFAVIEKVEGNQVMLKTLNTVNSQNYQYSLFVTSRLRATALPAAQNATRQEVCVTEVQPLNVTGYRFIQVGLVNGNSFVERHGLRCIATVADFRGVLGVPIGTLKPETVVKIHMNGDWRLE